MKIWPIITLGGLLYGSTFSDGMNTGRESNPHPLHHRSSLDAEIEADFKPLSMPHRPVTMAFREVFAKLLADQTEWTVPEGKTATAEATDDADDGEDPGKKLFWHSVFPTGDGVPFPGWGYPDPDRSPLAPPACGECRPSVNFEFEIIEDPAAPRNENDNLAAMKSTHIPTLSEGFSMPHGMIEILTGGKPPDSSVIICLVAMPNGQCALPCNPLSHDPLCIDPPTTPMLPVGPTDPIVIDPNPITAGGGSGSGTGGGFGGGGGNGGGLVTGTIPEPSTWVMSVIGFIILGVLGIRRRVEAARRAYRATMERASSANLKSVIMEADH